MPDKIENFNPNSYYNSPAPITQNFAFNIPSTIDASNIISKSTNTINAFKQAQNLKNFTNIGNIAGAAGTVVSSLLGDKREYSGTYGNVARTADSIYDTASDVISVIPGWGTAVSGIMKGAGALNQVMGKLGNSNDGMTVQDALLSSKIFNVGGLNPVSWVANGFGKKSISMENQDFISQERLNSNMDAYSGSQNTYESAMKKANKKYSLFSNGARHGANGQIRKANAESDLRLQVYDNNLLSQIRGMQQTSINNQGYQNLINGDLRTAAFGRKGLKLVKRSRLKNIINLSNEKILENQQAKNKQEEVEIPQNEQINLDNKEVIDSFQKGGKPEKKEEINDNISLEDFINQKIQERTEAAIKKATTRKTGYKFKNKSWKNCIATATDNYGVPICLRNSDLAADPKKYGFEELQFGDNTDTLPDGVLIQDYNKPNDYTTPGHTIMLVGRTETGAPIYSYSSGSSDPSDMHNSTTNYFFDKWNDKVKPRAYRYIGTPAERAAWEEEYRAMYPEVEAFKEGGQMNVIPEGALHARKNNMEGAGEDFTAKGIPVVDNNGEQQAEIEKEEWTMTKELTDDVEKWYKEYYKEDTSQKDKDELAIKCGKRITKELLHNTDDRANLITKMLEEEE